MSSKITALAVLVSVQSDDVLPLVDVHDTSMAASGTTKKIAVSDLHAALLPLAGGTMSGAIAMGSHKITGLTNGSAASDAAALGQVGVTSVAAGDTSVVVGGTAAAPTVATATLDVIAADHPPAAAWSNNNHALTNVAVLSVSGNTGATSASRYAGATGSGAPVSGTFNLGDFTVDQSGTFWVCTAAGTPGTWAAVAKVSQIPSSLPPNGAAGGVLSGTYPNPGITTLNQSTTGTASNITGTLDQVPAPAASVSLNSKKITGLANGSAATDAAAFGQVPVTSFAPTGLTGATAASRYVGATTSGAPASGTFAVGDFTVDQTGTQWVCTGAGTPGTWVSLLPAPLWAGLTNGEATLPRLGQGDSGSFGDTPASGVLHLTLFRAVTNGTYQHIGFQTGGTAAAAITLSKVGLYSVSGSTYTLLSGSATSAFSGTFANQSKALGAAQTLTAGALYAVAQLQVGTTPASTIGSWFNGMVLAGNPDYAFTLAAQSDLPASIAGGLSTSQFPMYYEVTA